MKVDFCRCQFRRWKFQISKRCLCRYGSSPASCLCRSFGLWYNPYNLLQFPELQNISLRNGPHNGDDYADKWLSLEEYFQVDDDNYTERVKEALTSENQPSLFWIDDEDYLNKTKSTLRVVATLPTSSMSDASCYCCSIDSRCANATITAARSRVKIVTGVPSGFTTWGTFNPTYRPIRPTVEWVQYLNPALSGPSEASETVFSAGIDVWIVEYNQFHRR